MEQLPWFGRQIQPCPLREPLLPALRTPGVGGPDIHSGQRSEGTSVCESGALVFTGMSPVILRTLLGWRQLYHVPDEETGTVRSELLRL